MFPSVIKQQKFDIANGVDITFVERPPDAYATEFNSGEFQVGGSASVLIFGLGATRGIKTSYLFNLFDYWGTVVTSRPDIKTLADLAGKQLAAAKGTTNYTMFAWLAKQQGVDPEFVPGGQHGAAGPCRLCAGRPRRRGAVMGAGLYSGEGQRCRRSIPSISISPKVWRAFAGGGEIPYLGVAAHQDWIDAHRDLVPRSLSRL